MSRRTGFDKASLGVLDLAARRRGFSGFGDVAPVDPGAPISPTPAPSPLGPAIAGAGGGLLLGGPVGAAIGGMAGVILGAMRRPSGPSAPGVSIASPIAPPAAIPAPKPIISGGGAVGKAANVAAKDFIYSASLAKSITSGNVKAASQQILSNPKAAIAVGVRTAIAGVAGPIAYIIPALMKKTVNPATAQDQRERTTLEYWMRFGPTTSDRLLAAADLEVKTKKYGNGWGWTPEFERYRADPSTTDGDWQEFMGMLGIGTGAYQDQTNFFNSIYNEVMRLHADSGWPALASSLPSPANLYP